MAEKSVSRIVTDLFEPVNETTFNTEYREKQRLHISRSNPVYFDGLVSIEAISELFSTAQLYFPDIQLTQSGENIASTDYASAAGLIDAARLFARYRAGATIVVSGADRLFKPVAELCHQVQRCHGITSRANLYLSPPGRQGFRPHYDSHDVLIAQVSGEKVFRFYENNTELPYPEEKFEPEGFEAGKCTDEITVSAGDTLYIPRGMTHDALASDKNTPSLHLTFGLYPALLRDVLHALIDRLADSEPGLRHSVPATDWNNPGVSARLVERVRQTLPTESILAALPEVMCSLRDEAALSSRSSAHLVRESFSAPVSDSNDQVVLVKDRYLGHETLEGVLYCRTFGQVLEFRAPFDSLVETWLGEGSLPRSHFAGGGVKNDDVTTVLASLCDSGLCVIEKS